jgi:hypothetical protein
MIETSQRVPSGTPKNGIPLPQQLARLDLARLRAYRENLDFYHGAQWLESRRRRERRLTFNYAKTIVEKTASYVISGYSSLVDPVDGSPEEVERARRAESALREIHEANNLDQLDFDNEVDCSVLGDGAYKVIWDAREERVRVSAPDVQGLYAWWLGDDPGRVWRVACRYTLTREEAEALLGPVPAPRQGRTEHTVVEAWTEAGFQIWLDGAPLQEQANPYGFIPFVIYPNLREPKQFWGVSDLETIKEPLRELNRAMTQLSMILELSGNPIAVLENVTEAHDIAVQRGRCGRSRRRPAPTCWTCCTAAAWGCMWTTRTWCFAPSMTWRKCLAAPSARTGRPCPGWRSRWSWTRC